MRNRSRLVTVTVALAGAMMMMATSGCALGADAAPGAAADGDSRWSASTLNLDWATYNPLSLVVREQGLIEDVVGDDVEVRWIQSAGSNRANELLRAGQLDVGSTAGSAALQARANGSPVQVISLFSQPEWAALVVGPDSDIQSPADLAGRSVATIAGTDPYFFLLQTLDEFGLTRDDVEVVTLQHAEGRLALENGQVDAWIGLDPIMAAGEAESGLRLVHRDISYLSFGTLVANTTFLANHPDLAQVVVDAYEEARAWALAHPDELAELLAEAAGIDVAVATTTLAERTVLDLSPVPDDDLTAVLERVGPSFVESGAVASQDAVDSALGTLIEPRFAQKAAQR